MQAHPALPERAADDVGRFDVDAGQDAGQRLDQRHVAADVAQQRRELAADRARADDQHSARYLVEHQHVVGVEDAVAVELEPGQRPRERAGRQDQPGALELRAVRHAHVTGAGVDQRARPRDDGHVPVRQESFQPAGETVDDLLFALLAGAQVERRLLSGVDAELLGARHGAKDLGGLEKLLGRDATPVEASAPDALVLDQRDA